jgi:two-component system sensor histidine kinase ResE
MLAAALAKQEELDRAKNLFIQSVSHELRTPLGIIYGHSELLESGGLGELQPMQQQSAQIITRRARMLTDLVDDLSALLAAETQEFRREAIDPALLMSSMLAEFQIKAAESGIQMRAEIQDKLPWILGDPTHLRRVFDNLVANAFKFTAPGGSVIMRLYPEGKDLIIEVVDTGRGIPEDKLRRIFERFFQVEDEPKHRRQGTGLGLALVKEIIEAHRGQVTAQSKPGEGTTFQIWLPGHVPLSGAQ